jgi:hypothetical protein
MELIQLKISGQLKKIDALQPLYRVQGNSVQYTIKIKIAVPKVLPTIYKYNKKIYNHKNTAITGYQKR